MNPKGLIETFNRGAEQALGYRREEVIGRRIETPVRRSPRERRWPSPDSRTRTTSRNYETRFLAKDGQARNVLLTLSRLRDREGKAIGTIGISKDITEEKKLQRAPGPVAEVRRHRPGGDRRSSMPSRTC